MQLLLRVTLFWVLWWQWALCVDIGESQVNQVPLVPTRGPVPPTSKPPPPPDAVSRKKINVSGFPVYVYGVDELAPPVNGTVPEVAIVIYMHGRNKSAKMEDSLVRLLYSNIRQHMVADPAGSAKDVLIVSFDALNHGARTTDPIQRQSLSKNPRFLVDMYALVLNNRDMVSFLIDYLPAFLFPRDERLITGWIACGRSMGGHSTWHVLATEPRVRTGVVLIGMPDYNALIRQRTAQANLKAEAPVVPRSFAQLVNMTDPPMLPYTSTNPSKNPFWGKHIFQANGGADPLVPFSLSASFLSRLVLGAQGRKAKDSLEIFVQPQVPHQVTTEMLDLAGRWIYRWEIAKKPVNLLPAPSLPTPTHARPPAKFLTTHSP